MGKINYSKAEREFHKTLQKMRAKKLEEGKTITSKRAAEFYGLEEQSPRPIPEEPVAKLLREEAAREEAAEKQQPLTDETFSEQKIPTSIQRRDTESIVVEIEKEEEDTISPIVEATPCYESIQKAKPQSERLPKPGLPPVQHVPYSDRFHEPSSPLYILRQHILWLKRQHYDTRYELLGTTREEIMSFRRAKRLTNEQLARIKELNARAEEAKADIMTERGMQTDEQQVEKHKHKTKSKSTRFNVKDTWLQL